MAAQSKKKRLIPGHLKKGRPGAGGRASATNQMLFQQALALHRAGRLPEAESLYRRILQAEPQHPDALHALGMLAHQAGKGEIAASLIRQALSRRPDYVEALNNLGVILMEADKPAEAATAYLQVLALRPDIAEAHNNLGNALLAQGKLDEAVASFRRALSLRPDYLEARNNLAVTLQDLRRLDEAEACFRQVLALNPNLAEVHSNLGSVFNDQGRSEEAMACHRRAISLKPDYAEAHNNLGNTLKDQGRLDEAVAALRQALAFAPDYAQARSNLLFYLNYLPGVSQEEIYDEARDWGRRLSELIPLPAADFLNAKDPDRRLRVGYVSADFRNHSVAYFFEPLLKAHHREQVEVFCYASVRKADERTEALRDAADHWCSILGMPDQEAAARIRSDRIDILVDLGGHTGDNRLLVFARKPAPIQVTWLGYPNTTGLRAMDYRFTDAVADPPGEADALHSEQLLRLTHGFLCYQPEEAAPEPGPPPCLSRDHVTFGSCNNLAKVTPEVVRLWAAILRQEPRARLMLKTRPLADAETRQRYLRLFAEHGIEQERLTLLGWMPGKKEHLAVYQQIDIGLDTLPYNGTTTTCEALWMGVPVVTLGGDRHAARVGASIMHQVGLDELVAHGEEEYVALALALARDRQRLNALRAGLRQKMQESPLMDSERFARTVENAYRHFWKKWCRGSTPPEDRPPASPSNRPTGFACP